MGRSQIDYPHNARTAHDPHLGFHAILLSFIDGQVIIMPVHTVAYHLGRHHAETVQQFPLTHFRIGGIVFRTVQQLRQCPDPLLQHQILPHQVFVPFTQSNIGQEIRLPLQHTSGNGIGRSEPYTSLIKIETKEQQKATSFQQDEKEPIAIFLQKIE